MTRPRRISASFRRGTIPVFACASPSDSARKGRRNEVDRDLVMIPLIPNAYFDFRESYLAKVLQEIIVVLN